MLRDRYDTPITTTSQAARDAYIKGVDCFLAANAGVVENLEAAIAADPGFAMAHMALARHYQMMGNRDAMKSAKEQAEALAPHASPQEQAAISALSLLLSGKVPDAYKAIREHVDAFPRDVMISQTCMGVFGLIGFSGKSDREEEQLAYSTALVPHYGDDWWFLSQHAFAQLEFGQTAEAEPVIERSLELNPAAGHSAHVRAHLYYENGEAAAGRKYLGTFYETFDRGALLHCHVSWHIALWALEQGDFATMWRVWEDNIAPGASTGPGVNTLTDSVALMYRAGLAGADVPQGRWAQLSDFASETFPKTGLAFADVHAALAHAMAGRADALQAIIDGARGPAGDVVAPLAKGFKAIAAGDWQGAEAALRPAMVEHARIGGSNAQRDLLEYALAQALMQQNRVGEARDMLAQSRPIATPENAIAGLH